MTTDSWIWRLDAMARAVTCDDCPTVDCSCHEGEDEIGLAEHLERALRRSLGAVPEWMRGILDEVRS